MILNNQVQEGNLKETPLGFLPFDWNVLPIKAIATFTKKPKGLNLSLFDVIPFIPMELISEQDIFIKRFESVNPSEISSGSYCERGDVLVAKITPSFENGKQGILHDIPIDFAYATTEIFAIKPNPELLDALFLFCFLKIGAIRAEIAGKMEGTTGRQRVPKSVIEDCLVPLPPLVEQKRIATLLKSLREDISAQDDIIHELAGLKYSLMAHLFRTGTNKSVAPKSSAIGEIPAHWEVVKFGAVVDIAQYGLSVKAGATGRYPMLRMNNLGYGKLNISDLKYVDLSDRIFSNFKLNAGDILFNRTNSYELVGKTALFDIEGEYTFASYIVRVVVQRQHLSPQFINHYLNFPGTQYRLKMLASRGASQSNISATKLKNFEIVLPPLEEQDQIAQLLDSIDEKIAAEEDRKSALEELFRTMLHQLMTGQIRLLSDEGLPL